MAENSLWFKVKTNKLVLAALIVVLALTVYFFFVRPAMARSSCREEVVNKLKGVSEATESTYNHFYQFCLHRWGI